jgi:uncharacterized protein (DUF924 family)
MSSLSPTDTEAINRIQTFWFPTDGTNLPKLWFAPNPTLDATIKSHFLLPITQARSGTFDHWTTTPQGTLALLILLDQFPRNIFRSSPDTFTSDSKALAIAVKAIAQGQDREVTPEEALFFYLPLMHAEDLTAQVATTALLEGFVARCEVGSAEREFAQKGLESAVRHLRVIERFGRFPKRNEVLGRESTAEELRFLEERPHGL